MIGIALLLLIWYVLGIKVTMDAILIALAIGMVADAVRSNRIASKETGLAWLRSLAEPKP